jgi:hypothetical protein
VPLTRDIQSLLLTCIGFTSHYSGDFALMNISRASIRRLPFLCLSLFILAFTGCSSSSSPDGVIEDLYSAISANRIDEAASHFSSKHLGQTNYAKQLQDHLRNVLAQANAQMQEQGGLDRVKIVQTKVDNPVALVEAEVNLKNGRTYRVDFSMTNEDGDWKAVLHDNNMRNLNLR